MGKRKELIGTVVSDKMQKTIVVKTLFKTKHPRYNRIIKRYNKFKVHDENKVAKVGDIVRIAATRPLSKEKSFMLLEVVKKAEIASVQLKGE